MAVGRPFQIGNEQHQHIKCEGHRASAIGHRDTHPRAHAVGKKILYRKVILCSRDWPILRQMAGPGGFSRDPVLLHWLLAGQPHARVTSAASPSPQKKTGQIISR